MSDQEHITVKYEHILIELGNKYSAVDIVPVIADFLVV
jgi:hypothetical protein